MEGGVRLAVAAAAEPVPLRLAARGRDRRDAGEPGKAGLGAQAAAVRPGDDQLGGDDRPDARLVEQRRGESAHVGEEFVLELGSFDGGRPDAAGEATQHEPGRELVGAGGCAAQAAAALEQFTLGQAAELVAERLRGRDDDGAQLRQCFAADVDGAATSEQQPPQRLSPLTCTRQRERLAGECRPRAVRTAPQDGNESRR